MNHHTRTTGMLPVLLAVPALAFGLMNPAEAAQDKKPEPRVPPRDAVPARTPDAVEGWLRRCSR